MGDHSATAQAEVWKKGKVVKLREGQFWIWPGVLGLSERETAFTSLPKIKVPSKTNNPPQNKTTTKQTNKRNKHQRSMIREKELTLWSYTYLL